MQIVKVDQDQLTLEELRKVLPSRKGTITQEIVDAINASQSEPEFQGETLLESMITYEKVMVNNKVGVKAYLMAVKYCAYLMSTDDSVVEAYRKTFSDTDFVKSRVGAPSNSNEYNELSSAASRYRKSKVVVDLLTISQVPIGIMFGAARYKAVMVLADIMVNSKYDRDRINAADKLLTHTESKDIKIDLEIGIREDSAIASMSNQLAELAARQKLMLEANATDLSKLGAMKAADAIDVEVE
jgi:hypothetical protein